MSDSSRSDPSETAPADGPGILAGLPHARPQRASARRAAARAAAAVTATTPSKPRPRRPQQRAPANNSRPSKRRQPPANPWADDKPAPRQGFEAEPDTLGPVQPPGGAELVASAAELAGELAKAGVTTGARVLRDFLSRLPG